MTVGLLGSDEVRTMSLESFVDGFFSMYVGFGEELEYVTNTEGDSEQLAAENDHYLIGAGVGLTSKIVLGAGILTALSATGMNMLLPAAAVFSELIANVFPPMYFGRNPYTFGGLVKKGIEELKLYRMKRQVVDMYNEVGPISREDAMKFAALAAELDTEEGLGNVRVERYPE